MKITVHAQELECSDEKNNWYEIEKKLQTCEVEKSQDIFIQEQGWLISK